MALIERKALIDSIKNDAAPVSGYAVVDWIMDMPTIDAVEAVRCGECKWRDTEKRGYGDECVCKRWSEVGLVDHYTAPTDFCSYGEKRGEGQQ